LLDLAAGQILDDPHVDQLDLNRTQFFIGISKYFAAVPSVFLLVVTRTRTSFCFIEIENQIKMK
jgi:hypothetical protein